MTSRTIPSKTRIDINSVTKKDIKRFLGDLNSYHEFGKIKVRLDSETLEILHRLSFGQCINHLSKDEWWRPDIKNINNYIKTQMIEKANSYKQDSIGAYKSDDIVTAICCERLRYRCLVDAYLAMNQQNNSRFDKWRFAKLRKIGAIETYSDLLVAEGIGQTNTSSDHNDSLKTIRRLAAKMEDIII